jgi:virginiamycin B lyase
LLAVYDEAKESSMPRRVIARTTVSMAAGMLAALSVAASANSNEVTYFDVPKGDGPHDVAPASDGTVWYTGQRSGVLGRLDPTSGKVEVIPLGEGSRPQGVIVGPDRAAWVTDGGQNAILRVDPNSLAITRWTLPQDRADAYLNTAAFDAKGRIWFTGQIGIYGRLDPKTGEMRIWDAPRGSGPYGITATPKGQIWYVSLAGSYLARPDLESGDVTVIDPPKKGSGTRRVWSDSRGQLWVSEWNTGTLSVYDPRQETWRSWALPGDMPQAYSVYVDEEDKVWVSDFPGNAILRFDPLTEEFESFPSNRQNANVRQMLGRKGEAWGAESGTDRLVVVRFGQLMQ